MPAPTVIVPSQPLTVAPLQAQTEHWLAVLRAHFELIRAEIRAELSSEHPVTRHSIDRLIARAANLDGQIRAVEGRRC